MLFKIDGGEEKIRDLGKTSSFFSILNADFKLPLIQDFPETTKWQGQMVQGDRTQVFKSGGKELSDVGKED